MKIHPFLGTPARILGKLLLFPILTTLVLLEPVVSFVCCFMMFGGTFAAIVFEVSAVGPRFPLLVIFGISLAFGVFLLLYQALIALFLRDYLGVSTSTVTHIINSRGAHYKQAPPEKREESLQAHRAHPQALEAAHWL